MPKHDNNNQCTNQPLTAQSIGEKPEPKERKKRKNAKANGKAKGTPKFTNRSVTRLRSGPGPKLHGPCGDQHLGNTKPRILATPAAMPPPMGGMERGMRPGMGQMGMNPAMMNPRMAMMNRMPHMMTPHGPMGNLPMGMMGGNRGPPGMGMSGPPGGPPMGMGPGGPGMPTSGQFNPMSSPGPNPMGMNTDSGTGPGIPPSGQSGPGGPGGPGQPGQVPPTSVSMPNNWPMMNGNQPTPFNPQQFNQQQPPPPTSVNELELIKFEFEICAYNELYVG